MNYFIQALHRYAEFGGRSGRKEYWHFFLWYFVIYTVLELVDQAMSGSVVMGWSVAVFTLALLVPSMAVGVRRLHDTDRSGWWLLITLVPILGVIVLIVFSSQNGDAGDNQYGSRPVEAG